jgi:DNA adenine methylase
VCSDINNDLINLWNKIKNDPLAISMHYTKLWNELNKDDDSIRRKKYFNYIRDKFNSEHNPLDFMFLMRTCLNGMPRFNSHGKFNTSLHITRKGINPQTLNTILTEWSGLLNKYDVKFICCSYDKIIPNEYDFCYLDPPYINTDTMYYGKMDYETLWNWIYNIKCKYALSFNGISGEDNNTYDVPKKIYKDHKYLVSGKSSFKRLSKTKENVLVYESLYIA